MHVRYVIGHPRKPLVVIVFLSTNRCMLQRDGDRPATEAEMSHAEAIRKVRITKVRRAKVRFGLNRCLCCIPQRLVFTDVQHRSGVLVFDFDRLLIVVLSWFWFNVVFVNNVGLSYCGDFHLLLARLAFAELNFAMASSRCRRQLSMFANRLRAQRTLGLCSDSRRTSPQFRHDRVHV